MSCVVSEKHIPRNMLIQKLQVELDSEGYVDTILMDLSKAYDCLSHDILISNLEAYGGTEKLRLIRLNFY